MRELADVLAEEKFDRYLTVNQRAQFIRLIASIAEFVPSFILSASAATPKMTSSWKWR